MKFIVSSHELLKSTQIVSVVVSPTNTLPVLNNLFFELSQNKLSITASDLETTIQTSLVVESEDVLDYTVPAKMFLEILKTFPNQPLTFLFNEENHTMQIVSDQGNYELGFESAEEYPRYPSIENSEHLEMSSASISEAINKTIFATGNDELRPVMTGVFFEISNGVINCVATDAHRLSKYSRTDIDSTLETQFIMPKKPLNLIKTLLARESEPIRINYNETNVEFNLQETKLSSRLIEGKYPNYNAVIPKENPNVLTINRGLLLTSLRRVSIFGNKSTHQVRFGIKGNSLTLSAENPDLSNKAEEKLVCDFNGTDMEIGFNSKFLLEMLQSLDSEDIYIEMSDPSRAGIIQPVDGLEDGEKVFMLVMPILLKA